jgi:membrane protein implicated in regulation of membrane protease activity
MIEFFNAFGAWIWLGLMVAFVIIEAFTMSLTTIWAAIASLPMIFIAKSGCPFKWQLLIFLLLTLVLIFVTRPLVIKKLKLGKNKTNIDALVGQEVLIVKPVSQFEKGQAKAKNGVIWTCQSQDGNDIPAESVCQIVSVEGNTITVKMM